VAGLTERKPWAGHNQLMTLQAKPPELEEAMRLDALERQQITDTPRDEAFDRVVRIACAALEAPMGAITFIESERAWVKSEHGLGINEGDRDISFCTHALTGDEVMVVEDASRDPRFAANPYVTCEGGVRFYAGAPLTTREGFKLGTLCVVDQVPRKISQRNRELLKDMAGIVVSEMELRRRVGTDALTGLYTRRFFNEVAGRELLKARREGAALTAAFIDADHFNDGLGHAAADALLRAIGPACRQVLRAGDLLGRGEELVAVLPGASLAQAAPVLERLRQEIAGIALPELEGRQVTVSIGAAELAPEDLTIEDLLARAGQALHRAREAGRNRIELAA
jgi:diguanylate cyclase (GGDEF)-like protein